MKGFIEVTNRTGDKRLINTQHIIFCHESFEHKVAENGETEKIIGTAIKLGDIGLFFLEDYKTVCSMIEEAQKG